MANEKGKFIAELHHMRNQCAALEREKSAQLYNRRTDLRKEICSLEETELKMANDRRGEGQELKQELMKLKNSVARFQQALQNVKTTPTFVSKLKELMEEIDASVRSFKDRQRKMYDELLREEQVLSEDVVAMEHRLETWHQTRASGSHRDIQTHQQHSAQPATVNSSLPPAVDNFERFLQQTGGHQGGWDDYDHQAFLRLRQRLGHKENFTELVSNRLPTCSAERARAHEVWYVEYISLLEKKKAAVQQWKLEQKAKREEALKELTEEVPGSEELTAKERLMAEKAALAKEKQRLQVKEWREEKDRQVKAALAKASEVQKQRTTQEEERQRRRRLEQKSRLHVYQQQRQDELALQKAAELERKQQERQAQLAALEHLERFQERDRLALEEKRQRHAVKVKEEMEKAQRLDRLRQQVAVHVERDPSRLTQMTAGWQSRRKETVQERQRDTHGPCLSLPHRAVPSWRQGI